MGFNSESLLAQNVSILSPVKGRNLLAQDISQQIDPITGSGLESLGIPDDPETQLIMAAVFRELLEYYADSPEACTVLFSE